MRILARRFERYRYSVGLFLSRSFVSSRKGPSFMGDCQTITVVQNSSARWAVSRSSQIKGDGTVSSFASDSGSPSAAPSMSTGSTSSVLSQQSLSSSSTPVGAVGMPEDGDGRWGSVLVCARYPRGPSTEENCTVIRRAVGRGR